MTMLTRNSVDSNNSDKSQGFWLVSPFKDPIDKIQIWRISAFGFLASQEVKDAGVGNLGLQDRMSAHVILTNIPDGSCTEREALRWIQRYIGAFGGDPTKVTM